MKRQQKGKDFIAELQKLCFKYKVSFAELEKIVKRLKNELPAGINDEFGEQDGNGFWGGMAKAVKKVMKKKVF